MKDIKTYKKVSTSERGSKDFVFYSEGWKNSDVYGFAFFFFFGVIENVSLFVAQNIW